MFISLENLDYGIIRMKKYINNVINNNGGIFMNEFDDFSNVIDNVSVERKKNIFKINQLKLEHFHWNFGELDVGMPITTSIELTCNYSFEKEKLEWKKIISHTYLSLKKDKKYTTDKYEEEIDNPDESLKKIENYDLRELKNNYFTEENPERFTHWELTYNHYFKIVGTYDQSIFEFEKISELLQFKMIINQEIRKIQAKFCIK